MKNRDGIIISIGAGVSQLPLIQAAQRLGRKVVAVDQDPEAPGFAWADLAIRKSTHDTGAILAALREIQADYNFVGVVARTTSAAALLTGVAVAQEFGLPGLTRDLVEIATEKAKLREFCQAHGLPVPPGRLVDSSRQDDGLPPFPVIIKPDVTLSGKTGIRLCRSNETLAGFVTEAAQVSGNRLVEVAAFIPGLDATCLCWANQGKSRVITWWDELVAIDQNDRLIGLGVSLPALLAETHILAIAEELVARLVGHFPEAEALLLISCRFTKEGEPYFIEVHADLGGDTIAEVLWPAAQTSIDFFELAVKVAESSLWEAPTFSCKPTALFYGADGLDLPVKILRTTAFQDIVVQQGEVEGNLALLKDVIQARKLRLHEGPGHLERLR
jgi:biotin carboxylase